VNGNGRRTISEADRASLRALARRARGTLARAALRVEVAEDGRSGTVLTGAGEPAGVAFADVVDAIRSQEQARRPAVRELRAGAVDELERTLAARREAADAARRELEQAEEALARARAASERAAEEDRTAGPIAAALSQLGAAVARLAGREQPAPVVEVRPRITVQPSPAPDVTVNVEPPRPRVIRRIDEGDGTTVYEIDDVDEGAIDEQEQT
jgi:hypothetical protein